MIYKAKVGMQNSKQLGVYSPSHSPSNNRKGSVLKINKFSPKPSHRENKENLDAKQPKTDRTKEEKYFKISKDEPLSSAKKPQKQSKISISISLNDKKKSIQQFDTINILNIETPKFKCSSNKIDDRCKTEHFVQNQNYFSFGNDFRQNMEINANPTQSIINNRQKKANLPLRQKNKNIEQPGGGLQKFSIETFKKREKWEKTRQGQERLQQRLVMLERQMRESKFNKDRTIFSVKK